MFHPPGPAAQSLWSPGFSGVHKNTGDLKKKKKGSSPSKELDENSVQWEMRVRFNMSVRIGLPGIHAGLTPHPVAALTELPKWRWNQMHRHPGATRAVP